MIPIKKKKKLLQESIPAWNQCSDRITTDDKSGKKIVTAMTRPKTLCDLQVNNSKIFDALETLQACNTKMQYEKDGLWMQTWLLKKARTSGSRLFTRHHVHPSCCLVTGWSSTQLENFHFVQRKWNRFVHKISSTVYVTTRIKMQDSD